MRRLGKLALPSGRELVQISQLLYWLAQARWQLTRQPIQQVLQQLARDYPCQPVPLATLRRQCRWLAKLAGWMPFRALCLEQALACAQLLAHHRVAFSLHIGVRRDGNDTFAAHAWVVVNDQVLLGGPVDSYRPLQVFHSHQAG